MSNWLQMVKCSKKNPTNFSAFAERIFPKAIFLKNETTKTLLRTVKTSILEPEKTTALSDEACLPRLCFEQNFMMENGGNRKLSQRQGCPQYAGRQNDPQQREYHAEEPPGHW